VRGSSLGLGEPKSQPSSNQLCHLSGGLAGLQLYGVPAMRNFADYHTHTGSNPNKFFKSTLFKTKRMLLGLNCLDPGQTQSVHTHADQDKFYFVVDGEGEFQVGEETRKCGPGLVVWVPAGAKHGVTNTRTHALVLLVGIAPAPGK